MYFVDRIQAQGKRQRKVPLPKKFWKEFPSGAMVKVELLDNPGLFYVEKVQAQGKIQRRIALPKKFWPEFPLGSMVRIELIKR
tara:strand:- start:404 stop:652 length:249 start_codon:yes stop_codon:yes gene_type:complete